MMNSQKFDPNEYEMFRMKYKSKVEQGMTLKQYLDHHFGDGSSSMFEALQAEVEKERKDGELFLEGFLSASQGQSFKKHR